jgi:hypothetical protein
MVMVLLQYEQFIAAPPVTPGPLPVWFSQIPGEVVFVARFVDPQDTLGPMTLWIWATHFCQTFSNLI